MFVLVFACSLHISGTVHVFLKDSIFEASSPARHTAELGRLIKEMFPLAVAIILFTDGGPDHNCKHTSVRLGLLSLFFELDLDTMVVMRTAPTQSWANPVERVMSVLNLGLQGVALSREVMADESHEREFKKCNGMSAVRKVANEYIRAPTVGDVADEGATGNAAANQKGGDGPLIAEEKDIELDVDAGSEVPIIEVDDGIAADGQKGDDEHLLAEERDIELDVDEEVMCLLLRSTTVLRQTARREMMAK
jgi:hypothetical protein